MYRKVVSNPAVEGLMANLTKTIILSKFFPFSLFCKVLEMPLWMNSFEQIGTQKLYLLWFLFTTIEVFLTMTTSA